MCTAELEMAGLLHSHQSQPICTVLDAGVGQGGSDQPEIERARFIAQPWLPGFRDSICSYNQCRHSLNATGTQRNNTASSVSCADRVKSPPQLPTDITSLATAIICYLRCGLLHCLITR